MFGITIRKRFDSPRYCEWEAIRPNARRDVYGFVRVSALWTTLGL